jgi:serine protease Do
MATKRWFFLLKKLLLNHLTLIFMKSFSEKTKLFVIVLLVSFLSGVIGGVAGFTFALRNIATDSKVTDSALNKIEQKVVFDESDAVKAIENVSGAVVSIIASKDLQFYRAGSFDPFEEFFFGRSRRIEREDLQPEIRRQQVGGGSGFVVDKDGLVVTNKHVIADKKAQYAIVLKDGTEFEAEFVSEDPFFDIALMRLKIAEDDDLADEKREKLNNLAVAQLGDSDVLRVGQKVYAIGNALSEYQNTVTSGIISGKGRDIVAGGAFVRSELLSGLLQTDAAINPGNSGGPLVNVAGQVIGINVAIDQNGSNVGFAIPVNDLKPALESVKTHGEIKRPMLGVRYLMLDEAKAKELQIDVAHGALLVGNDENGEFAVVPASPAEKAGLQMKDVILEIDGVKIEKGNDLHKLVRRKNFGDKLKLKVWRSGREIDVEAQLD